MANLDINKSLGLKKYRLTKIDLPFLFLLKNGTRMIWAERQNSYDPPSGWLCTVGNKWGFGPLSTAFWRRRERGCQKPRLLACPNKCLSRIKTVTKTGRFKLSEWCSLPVEQKNVRLDWCNPSGIGSAHVRRVSWVMATLSSLAFVCFDTHTRTVLLQNTPAGCVWKTKV